MDFFQNLTQEKVFIIAEVGVNHNGSMKLAKKLIDESKRIGADAVKFQVFNSKKLCSSIHKAQQIPMLDQYDLTNEQLIQLQEYAKQVGILWFATPFDEDSLQFLIDIKSDLLKVGSGELTHTPLLEKISQSNIPTIISSGGFEIEDIKRGLKALEKYNKLDVAILHCISQYPAELKNLNLKAINTIQYQFKNHVIGFSDHSKGYVGSVLAASLGAKIIEKHITLDNEMEGPDHKASLNVEDFKTFIDMVRLTPIMLGNGIKKREEGENLTGRSIVAEIDLKKGDIISEDILGYKRPGTHLKPYMKDEIIGKKLNKDIKKDDFLNLDDFI